MKNNAHYLKPKPLMKKAIEGESTVQNSLPFKSFKYLILAFNGRRIFFHKLISKPPSLNSLLKSLGVCIYDN